MNDNSPSDIRLNGIWQKCPERWHRYILIARLDRPIGWWLLILPGWWVITGFGADWFQISLLMFCFMMGGIVTRGAGCIINDLWDRDIDRKIARTASRPLAGGSMSEMQATGFLLVLTITGLGVLLQLPPIAWLVGIASAPLVILYPLAKRVTYFPQIVLGLTFSWAVPTAFAALSPDMTEPAPMLSMLLLYLGTVAWVFGYDTIYAVQDLADDALTGVKSSALGLGRYVPLGVGLSYLCAVICWIAGFWLGLGAGAWMAGVLAAAIHLGWQVTQIELDSPLTARRLFLANRDTGLMISAGCIAHQLISF